MDFAQMRTYLAAKPGATEEHPFDETTLVFKVAGKMFALIGENETPARVTLKSDPDEAIALRAQYPGVVVPGYYMNKQHWNTITLNGTIAQEELHALADSSYTLVVSSLPKAKRTALAE